MAFEQKYLDYKYCEVVDNQVRVYYGSFSYDYLNSVSKPVSAEWSGDAIIVRENDGKVKRYTSRCDWQYVY